MLYLRLRTNRGWIDLATSEGVPHPPIRIDTDSQHADGEDDEHAYEPGHRYGYGLSVDKRWIC